MREKIRKSRREQIKKCEIEREKGGKREKKEKEEIEV